MVIIPDFTADTRQREKNTGKRKENVRSTTVYTKKRFYKSKNNKIKKQEKYQKYISNDKVSFDAKGMEDYDWTSTKSYASEMVKIMGMLLGERQVCINRASSRYKQGEQVPTRDFMGVLDDFIDIWFLFIEHRTLR